MAIDTTLLIAAPILQDYFSDNATDAAMSNGVITCFQDNSRTTLKNWYYQTGSPGNYTYAKLDNPLTLSAAGTITDPNGVDTIPFWYPYSETDNVTPQPYYVTVDNSNGQRQFVRQNFPFVPTAAGTTTTPTLRNYIVNNVFWRNVGSVNATTLPLNPLNNLLSTTLAPSQHDGFSIPDLTFVKNVNGATDTITFNKFALGSDPLMNDITPEYYINHNCSSVQAGETTKSYFIPVSLHVKTLDSVDAVVTIQAQSADGNPNNKITLQILQYLGTGAVSPSPFNIGNPITLSTTWTKYQIPFTTPSALGVTLASASGGPSDDAIYLMVTVPMSQTFNINFTKPSFYIGTKVPTNDFDTYDDIDAYINSPRTGDFRTSLNTFYPYGWIAANDQTIGSPSSGASARANSDSYPLYNLIWNSVSNTFAPILTSGGVPTTRGANAITDFQANKQLTITKTVGRVLAGAEIPSGNYNKVYTTNFAVNNNLTIVTSNIEGLYTGSPVMVASTGTLSSPLVANTFYFAIVIDSSHIQLATTAANAYAGTAIALLSDGSGTQTVISYLLGSYEGQESHTMTLGELVTHSHQISVGTGASTNTVGNNGNVNTGTANTGNTGSSVPFPLVQYTTYMNMFIKL